MATAKVATTASWQQVVTSGDYMVQNIGRFPVLAHIGGVPTAGSTGFFLGQTEVISSSIAPGVVYVKNAIKDRNSAVIVLTV